jgi:hypothetical protein
MNPTPQPSETERQSAVPRSDWLGAITRLSREIFELSQKRGMPSIAREAMDDAREELHRAKVNINFALYGS